MNTMQRHPNGGGLVAHTAKVHPHAYVGAGALVKDHAEIGPEVELHGGSSVGGTARLTGKVQLYDLSSIHGQAQVSGDVILNNHSQIGGHARIENRTTLCMNHYAQVRGHTLIMKHARIDLQSTVIVTGQSILENVISLSDNILINAHLLRQPIMVIKGLLPMDMVVVEPGIIWFSNELNSLRYSTRSKDYTNDLDGILNAQDFEKLDQLSDLINRTVLRNP